MKKDWFVAIAVLVLFWIASSSRFVVHLSLMDWVLIVVVGFAGIIFLSRRLP